MYEEGTQIINCSGVEVGVRGGGYLSVHVLVSVFPGRFLYEGDLFS